jgi:replication initiation and membrane attachment protein DnaB
MKTVRFDFYVLDGLMPDLVGHDKQPSAFIVYLYLWTKLASSRSRTIQASHQTIANETGLSKSAVQAAMKNLTRRRLVKSQLQSRTAIPEYTVLRPWRKSKYT